MNSSIFKTSLLVIFTSLLVAGIPQSVKAQYKTAIGVRLGSPLSISAKHFVTDPIAIEAYVGTRGFSFYRLINLSLAVQYHQPIDIIDELEGLQVYAGAGGSVYFWNYGGLFEGNPFGASSLGLQAYGGFDYAFAELPLNISLDWIPTVFLGGDFITGIRLGYGSLGIRYTLGDN